MTPIPADDGDALYRVTKQEGGTFTFTLISKNPAIQTAATLPAAGKEKILPQQTFENLSIEELTNPFLWQQLLDIQTLQQGCPSAGLTTLHALLHPLL